jgi:hypothetical protein
VQEKKILKWKAITNTSSLACSTIECLQRMHNSIVTAFNGNTNYTKPNNEVPPKDAATSRRAKPNDQHTT